MNKKINATKVSMGVAFTLAIVKGSVGVMTGSLAVLTSAVDSLLDIMASFFNFLALRQSAQPADRGHQFGHGKYEAFAAFIQSIVILLTGFLILYAAWEKVRTGDISEVSIYSIAVMVVSIVATLFLTIFLRRTARREKSVVLEADSMHYSIDLLTNAGILLALLFIKLSGFTLLDPIISAIVGIYIIYSALKLSFKVSSELLDSQIAAETYHRLIVVLDSFDNCMHFHDLRTRSAGSKIFIDMHLTMDSEMKLKDVHKIIDDIEDKIRQEIPEADITIHPEPTVQGAFKDKS